MNTETSEQRRTRILQLLREKYPHSSVFDLDGNATHFVCEVEPTAQHPDYDVAVEVIISSKPHRHARTTQFYKILSGVLQLNLNNETFTLNAGDELTIAPGVIHWATSENECWVEIRSEPGWTAEDHIVIDLVTDEAV